MATQILRTYKREYLRVNGSPVTFSRVAQGYRVVVDGMAFEFTPKTLVEATKVLAGRLPVRWDEEQVETTEGEDE